MFLFLVFIIRCVHPSICVVCTKKIPILIMSRPYDFVIRIAVYIYIYNGLNSLCCINWRAISCLFSVSCNILFLFFSAVLRLHSYKNILELFLKNLLLHFWYELLFMNSFIQFLSTFF
jgi:hypothetical protein